MDKQSSGRKTNSSGNSGSVEKHGEGLNTGSVGGSKQPSQTSKPAQTSSQKPAQTQKPASTKPATQSTKPAQTQKPASTGTTKAGEPDKGIAGDLLGAAASSLISNAISNNSGSSSNNSLGSNLLSSAAGNAKSSSGCRSRIIKIILIIAVILLAIYLLKKCGIIGGGQSYDYDFSSTQQTTETPEYANPQATATYTQPVENLPEVTTDVTNKSRNYYYKPAKGDTVTVMVYMCASDLESGYGLASSDLSEMFKATFGDNVNVIVETGGTKQWKATGVQNNTIYKLVPGKGLTQLKKLDKQSMTDPDNLSNFIRFCAQNFPANRNILIFWDHGGGSATGYGHDEVFTSSGSMTLDKIDKALKNGGIKFDFIGFDACLMATLENAMVCEQYADYLIASEESEPGYGWDYTGWLTVLGSATNTKTTDLAKRICDDYAISCKKGAAGSPYTLSCIDLKELAGTIPTTFNLFAQSTTQLMENQEYQAVSRARANSHEFAASSKINQCDVIDFATKLNTGEAVAFAKALKSCVKYNVANVNGAYGVSIYFPYNRTSTVSTMVNTYDKIDLDDDYAKCIRTFASLMTGGQISSNGSGSLFSSLTGSSYSSAGSSSDLLNGFFGGSSSSSGGFLDSLVSGYSGSSSTSDYYDSYLSNSYGSGSSSSGSYGSLLGSLFGNTASNSSSSSSSLSSSLLSSLFSTVDSNRMIQAAPYYDSHMLDANKLKASNVKLGAGKYAKLLVLEDAEWNLITNADLCVLIDDGEGYIDLGQDHRYSWINGQLVLDYDGLWLAIGGQVVACYPIVSDDDAGFYLYRMPALVNNELADVMVAFTGENSDGAVIGFLPRYEGDVDVASRTAIPFIENDTIQFICDYYTYDGHFKNSFKLNDAITVGEGGNASLTVEDVTLKNVKAVSMYRLTDIYGNSYWTEALKYNY